jgi:hypothetical protein
MTIKFTSKSKKPYLKFNHTKYFGFKLSSLPRSFAEVTSEEPINRVVQLLRLYFYSPILYQAITMNYHLLPESNYEFAVSILS